MTNRSIVTKLILASFKHQLLGIPLLLFFTLLICSVACGEEPEVGPSGLKGTAELRMADQSGVCSATLVRFDYSVDDDRALVLSAGHCIEQSAPGEAIVQEARNGQVIVKNESGTGILIANVSSVLFSTMTHADIALLELERSYGDLEAEFGPLARTISRNRPMPGQDILVRSGFFNESQNCRVQDYVNLKESVWNWPDTLKHSCPIQPGWSGSPMIDSNGEVVGVNNTSAAEDITPCSLNAPCEVQADESETYELGASYGQPIAFLYDCSNRLAGGAVDEDCPLP